MNEFESILTRLQEHQNFLNSIDLPSMKQKYSRQELTDLNRKLSEIKNRSLTLELGQLIAEMKFEEYPELLGVHHYPILKEADFLTEQEQKAVDDHLVLLRKGEFLYVLRRILKNTKKLFKLEQFLIQKGIAREVHVALCPSCGEGYVSDTLSREQKDKIDSLLKMKPDTPERYELLSEYLKDECTECVSEMEIDSISEINYKSWLVLIQGRDTSLDNV